MFFLEGNCCEVAAGSYPRLAELVYPALKLKQGSLTIYDPHLCFSLFNKGVVAKKEKFTTKTNIDGISSSFSSSTLGRDSLIMVRESTSTKEKRLSKKSIIIVFAEADLGRASGIA